MLINEKYCGNVLVVKTCTAPFPEWKRTTNKGEKKQYFAVGTHPAVISEEQFNAVQEECRRRSNKVITEDGSQRSTTRYNSKKRSSVGEYSYRWSAGFYLEQRFHSRRTAQKKAEMAKRISCIELSNYSWYFHIFPILSHFWWFRGFRVESKRMVHFSWKQKVLAARGSIWTPCCQNSLFSKAFPIGKK